MVADHDPSPIAAPPLLPAGGGPVPASMARRRLALGLLAVPTGLALAGCVAAPPRAALVTGAGAPVDAPRVRAGDRWRYVEINGFNGERVADVAAEAIEAGPRLRIRLEDSRGRPRGEEVYADPWRVVVEPMYDQPQFFESPVPILPETLVPGARSRTDTAYTVPGSSGRYGWQQRLEARRWQRIRVPAGEFDTLLVQRRIWFDHPDRWRRYPHRWDLAWYAPAVNRWVRREWSGEYRASGRRGALMREDWIIHELIEHLPSPT